MEVVVSTGKRRSLASKSSGISGVVAAGSVWETRMKNDEVKGGIKVFGGNGEERQKDNNGGEGNGGNEKKRIVVRKGQNGNLVSVSGKRKTWKGETFIDEKKQSIRRSTSSASSSPVQVLKKGRSEEIGKKLVENNHLGKSKSDVVIRKSDEIGLVDVKSENGEIDFNNGGETEEIEVEIGSDENYKVVDVCEEKNVVLTSDTKIELEEDQVDDDKGQEDEDDDVEVEDEDPEEEEKNRVDVKEINIEEEKPKKVVNLIETKSNQFNNTRKPTSSVSSTFNYNNQTPFVSKKNTAYYSVPQTHTSKLQNLVDLVMWKDVSKSAFVFGLGTFVIISSSYTQDLNFSFISVISYLGLIYLAAIFIYRAIIYRGVIDEDEGRRYVVGEEEAVWILKVILPYLNEFLLKLKALFSGDPATTMKLAVLLFVLARCGSSITIWKMTKLGFFGVFIIPKLCSSYSSHLTAYGKFWIRRFRDAWDSCSHKKAVAIAIFTLVWNLSSIVARTWAAFMLFVALRYYQQKMVTDEWVAVESEHTWKETISGRPINIIREVNKAKKGF